MLDVPLELYFFVRTVVVEVLGTPEVFVSLRGLGVLGPGVLVDLEELAGTVGRRRVLDLGHIGEDGSPVGTTDGLVLAAAVVLLLVHLNGDFVTSCESALALGRGRADVAYKVR